MHSAPTLHVPAGPAASGAFSDDASIGTTIDGGSDARPMITIPGSEAGVAGSPPTGRKKLACSGMSSEISDQSFSAHSLALVAQALAPEHEKRNSLVGSDSVPVESARCVQ